MKNGHSKTFEELERKRAKLYDELTEMSSKLAKEKPEFLELMKLQLQERKLEQKHTPETLN